MTFKNRKEAGKLLAKKILGLNLDNVLVFGLPRGGVVVAAEVAEALSAPLDMIVVRKLGSLHNPELAFGAIAPQKTEYIDWEFAERIGIGPFEIKDIIKKEQQELKRREKLYRGQREYRDLSGKNIIIVDDGIATGATVKATIEFLRRMHTGKIIVATPVCASDTASSIRSLADMVLSLFETNDFYAVGQFYLDFPQITDDEVMNIMKKHSK